MQGGYKAENRPFLVASLLLLSLVAFGLYTRVIKISENEPIKYKNSLDISPKKENNNGKYSDKAEKHRYNETEAILLIQIHTSEKTMNRLPILKEIWGKHQLIQSGRVLVQTILPRKPNSELAFPAVPVGCNGERIFAACRFQRGYELFHRNYSSVPWLYVCDDDTWFNIDFLWTYLKRLMSFSNPMEHIIVKGHANKERVKRYFLHGGTGWLMSNAFIDFCITNNINMNDYLPYSRYRQPDTSESIILRLIFPEINDWDEMYFQGYECVGCNVRDTDDWYKEYPKCPTESGINYGRVNEIVTLHTIGLENNKLFSEKIKSAPNYLLYYRGPNKIILCHDTGNQIILNYTTDSLKKRTKLYVPKDIKLPLCDFTKLPDECCTND